MESIGKNIDYELISFSCIILPPLFHHSHLLLFSSTFIVCQCRRGRWTDEELDFALSLIEAFNGSLLPLSEGLPLAPFLCKMLQCCSARLSSKIRKGKKIFHLKRGLNTSAVLSPSEINHYRGLQEKISDTEHLFLNKIAESCDPEDASILSYHIQHAWIKEFIDSAQGKMIKDKLRYDSFALAIPPIDSSLRGYVQQPNRSENKHFSRLWAMAPSAPAWNGENTGPAAAFIADFRAVNAQFASSGEMGLAVHLKSDANGGDDSSAAVMFEASPSLTHIVAQFAGKEHTSAITLKDFENMFKNHTDLVRAITSDSCSDSGFSSSSLRVQAHHRIVDLQLLDNEYGCVCVIDVLFVGSTISLSSLRFRQQHGHDYIFGDTTVSSSTFRSASIQLSQSGISVATELTELNMRKKRRLDQSRQQAALTRPARGLNSAADAKLIASRLTSSAAAPTEGDAPDVNYSARSISLQRACGPFLLTSDKHQLTQHSDSGVVSSSGKRSRATSDSGDSVRGSIGENALAMLNEGIPFTRTTSGVSHGSISSVGSKDGLLIEEVLDREPVVNIVYTGHLIGQRESRSQRGSAVDSTSQEQVPLLSSTANKPTLLSATSTVGAPVTSSSATTSSSTALSRFRAAAASAASVVPISFDSILQSFLRVIPFHVIEIWVPVQLEHGGTVLLYGGSAALDKELHGWSNYSRNFSFNPDVGLPGRVAAGRTAESSNDVSKLPVPQFLRAEMAGELGIHAACGLPFFTGNKCDAVVVFYSRHVFEPSKGLIEYMGKVCESLNIRAHIRVLQQEKQESIFK